MSQHPSGNTPTPNGAAAAETQSVQLALRLRASERSDRAILSNVSAVHTGTGLVFIDFGFVDQRAIDEVTNAVRAGSQHSGGIDGRLECRIAMGAADIAQLVRQLQQVLAAASHQQATARMDAEMGPGPDASLQ